MFSSLLCIASFIGLDIYVIESWQRCSRFHLKAFDYNSISCCRRDQVQSLKWFSNSQWWGHHSYLWVSFSPSFWMFHMVNFVIISWCMFYVFFVLLWPFYSFYQDINIVMCHQCRQCLPFLKDQRIFSSPSPPWGLPILKPWLPFLLFNLLFAQHRQLNIMIRMF